MLVTNTSNRPISIGLADGEKVARTLKFMPGQSVELGAEDGKRVFDHPLFDKYVDGGLLDYEATEQDSVPEGKPKRGRQPKVEAADGAAEG